VHCFGKKWQLVPPSRRELYPNMNNAMDAPWHRAKCDIADTIGELTSLWMVGVNNRNKAITSGIVSWRDLKCTAAVLNINGTRAPVLNAILKINSTATQTIISPDRIISELYEWREIHDVEYYIDFETVNDAGAVINDEAPFTDSHACLFMIGITVVKKGKARSYINLSADRLNYAYCEGANNVNTELIILQRFHKIMKKSIKENARCFHWSSAEPSIYRKACRRANIIPLDLRWCDLLTIFHAEPIVVRGAFNFSLKTIASNMYRHGLISSTWYNSQNTSNALNGLSAMMFAIRINKIACKRGCTLVEIPEFQQIINYNKIDCDVLYDIMHYLRREH